MTENEFNAANAETQRRVLNNLIRNYSGKLAEDRRSLSKPQRIELYGKYCSGMYTIIEFAELVDDTVTENAARTHRNAPLTDSTENSDMNEAEKKLKQLQDIIGLNSATVDTEQVKQIVAEEMDKRFVPQRVQLVIPDRPEKPASLQHHLFPKIAQLAAIRKPVLLVGEAGSGKTHVAQSVAKELDLPFYSISCCNQTTQSQFFGYKSITTGEYFTTDFYKAFTGGGIFLFDEMDACNTSTMLAVNSAIANRFCAFPTGNKAAHPDFTVIAGANTFGGGADKRYTGRQRLDKASTDRFIRLRFDYDESLERALALNINSNADQWVTLVQKIRIAVDELKIDILVSPRTTIQGAELLTLGWSEKEALEALCFAGVEDHTVAKIMNIAA